MSNVYDQKDVKTSAETLLQEQEQQDQGII